MSLEFAAWGLLLLAIADVGCTLSMIRGANRERATVLTERAIAASLMTVTSVSGAILALAFLTHVKFGADGVTVLLVSGYACAALPQLIWFSLMRRGNFQ